jgi:ABC-type uncharacterized transport system auxiliary subunit
MRQLAILLLAAPLLAGCLGSAPPVPRDHYYRLLVPTPAALRDVPMLPGVMTVELPKADGLLRERALLYSESGESYELQQHSYHYWNDVPPRMLQDQMVAYLRRGNVAHQVVTPDMRLRADYQVTGKVRRLERLLGATPPRVVVEMEFALQRLTDDSLLVVETYSAEETAADETVEASVVALNRATATIFDRFLSEVRLAAGQVTAKR